jgi:hypothetical protein
MFYNARRSIEEFVIDSHGLWKLMPYYKVVDPCVWDLAVAVIISVAIWWAFREGKNPRSMDCRHVITRVNPLSQLEQ